MACLKAVAKQYLSTRMLPTIKVAPAAKPIHGCIGKIDDTKSLILGA
jgi:hypothetical protein